VALPGINNLRAVNIVISSTPAASTTSFQFLTQLPFPIPHGAFFTMRLGLALPI
jgi:hypothetical protein